MYEAVVLEKGTVQKGFAFGCILRAVRAVRMLCTKSVQDCTQAA